MWRKSLGHKARATRRAAGDTSRLCRPTDPSMSFTASLLIALTATASATEPHRPGDPGPATPTRTGAGWLSTDANDYNLSVSSYVEAKDNREVVNISQLNAELKTTVAKIDQLRKEIDALVAEIEGGELEA